MMAPENNTAEKIKDKSRLYLPKYVCITIFHFFYYTLLIIIISWLSIHCGYYYTVAIIHMAVNTVAIIISGLLLHCGYYAVAIITVAIMACFVQTQTKFKIRI